MIDTDVNGKMYMSLSLLSYNPPTLNLLFENEVGDSSGIGLAIMGSFLCTLLEMNRIKANQAGHEQRFLPGETIDQNIRRLIEIINPELTVLDDPERLQFLVTHPDRNFEIHVGYGPEEP